MIYGSQDYAELIRDIIKHDLRHPLYHMAVAHAKEMSVHINGDQPLYLLERNRPREDEDVKLYRIENYEPTTKAGADKAIKIVCKGFNPNLYSIHWKEKSKEAEELEKYTLEYYPGCNSIVNFNKDVLLRKMLADPNGMVAVKPQDVPDDDTDQAKPVTVIYGSSANYYYDKDHYLFCVNQVEDKDKHKIFTFEYYDKTQYLTFEAYWDPSNKEVVITELEKPYVHSGGKIPVWPLGGESKNLDNGLILYQSFFSAALPHWNLAVKHGSDLMAAIVNNIFPQKYEVADECAYSEMHGGVKYNCRGGKISRPTGSKAKEVFEAECPQCHGAGLVAVKGPFQQYLWHKDKLNSENGPLGIAPAGYLNVPIESTEFLDEYTEKMNQKAMWAINMDIEEKVGENQSGVAKAIDRSAQNDTLFDIHSRVWDVHTNNEYYFINIYINKPRLQAVGKEADKKYLPEINKPTKFDLLSTSELIYNFDVSQKAKLDRNILRTQAIAIIKSENGSTPDMKNYQIALVELDPLYAMPSEEIDLSVTKGVVKKNDWAIHNNIKSFIDRALAEDKDFLTKMKQDQLKKLDQYASELITAEQPRVDESLMMKFDREEQQNAA